jgi:predicted peptidase
VICLRLASFTLCALLAIGCSRGGDAVRGDTVASPPDASDSLIVRMPDEGREREVPVRLFFPVGYDSARSWPVVLFLHGSGEVRGDDLEPTRVGLPKMLRLHPERLPAIVVIPQLRGTVRLVSRTARGAARILDTVITRYHGDPTRVTITGTSMGAWAAIQLAMDEPQRYAALLLFGGGPCPNCFPGQTDANRIPYQASHLLGIPIWAWHGERDQHVPVQDARDWAAALKAAGADIRYTEISGGPHNIWDPAYADTAVIGWLMRQRRPGAAHAR